ncbi:hypothetical protein [Proteiniphilum saccharofermentans]|uniref:hypothetical protein n=1 Tax=Proteiniphilum saccharofermentans TaxID=1642647 RepID=UPI0028ACD0BD|nr:hypothetical protein [Proteiniphilum saccharofermentans]
MKKILFLLLIILVSCEKSEVVTENDFSLSGTTWTMYKEEVKEERVGIDGTIRKRSTYWHCNKTANGESCTLVTLQNQWDNYRDDDVVHDITYKTTGKIEFTAKSVRVHLKRSYSTVFGEFHLADIHRDDEYFIIGRIGQDVSGGYLFTVLKDEKVIKYGGDYYARE